MKQQIKNNIMNTHESTLKKTNLWVILDEEKLSIVKGNGQAMKFKTEEEADRFASSHLHLWIVVNINFLDKWWKHEASHDKEGRLLNPSTGDLPIELDDPEFTPPSIEDTLELVKEQEMEDDGEEWISDDERAKRNPNKFKK